MADRSTAAVDAGNEGGAPRRGTADAATTSEATDDAELDQHEGAQRQPTPDDAEATAAEPAEPVAPALHSGHKLAARYRLEECVTRDAGFSSWRAVDEMLRRAVGIHLLPSGTDRAKKVLAAARSAALLGDPRFVQVLDAVEDDDLVYVVHEWLPDAAELTALLAAGPLQPYDAYQMVRQLSEAMAAAAREGLAHLKLDPQAVLRTEGGQFRIRGLAVAAALHGAESAQPQREDTEAIGALLYASLTQRWPYPEDAFGLTGLPGSIGLVAPDQVRAGVHRGLSELAMRALVNDGATPSRQEPACATPEELTKAVAALPKVRPPEPELPPYQRTTYQQGVYRQPPARRPVSPPAAAPAALPVPPALPGRTGKALKWTVSALLIVALGLGSWQVADALLHHDKPRAKEDTSSGSQSKDRLNGDLVALPVRDAREFAPDGKFQKPNLVNLTYDDDKATYWRTFSFNGGPTLAPFKAGVGIIYDLGSSKSVSGAKVSLQYGGDRTTGTLYATDSLNGAPVDTLTKIADATTNSRILGITADKLVKTRYVLLWLTELPRAGADDFSGSGYKQGITDLSFTGRQP